MPITYAGSGIARIARGVLAAAVLAGGSAHGAERELAEPSYLKGAPLVLPAQAAPAADGDAGLLDLYLVRTAQRDASPAARTEAFDDAAAYFFDDLMPRFSEAAGAETPLSATGRPILAHVLRSVLNDVMFYSGRTKAGHPRTRPYAETAPVDAAGQPMLDAAGKLARVNEIAPCFTFKLGIGGSYPSGHAANGYAAALVLAEAFPERRAEILARGARYGDNRVLCGVHHPVDVERGRAVARIVFAAVQRNAAFQRDIACVGQEANPRRPAAGNADCQALGATYGREMVERRIERLCTDLAPAVPRPAACPAIALFDSRPGLPATR